MFVTVIVVVGDCGGDGVLFVVAIAAASVGISVVVFIDEYSGVLLFVLL